ncbi:G-protein coupled bile acid receptor 1 [Alosa sapidissima]|uniref:G-protein coupled bile acid receptor 1 n=1 Tax=Alosa sapidissima TaxID=34773 RepID=UPI001C09EEF9|nr:G-protein coupled bile acid receptor 1 [Alosa sapidissima]XP_041937699.1 G-protein coupled bile acid receptor 1 [Alosa sapidissima]XP_041937700.1 G-protein coupled bile acid receptor 1 [Alosa sapidissima]XP_041937701.1 G-protein coupled bile acid receptor 1 [Alosa sapidissima]XP_041937702.1 G-protein coupled bile acid receptor 1 [Alosa sapidissima]XP_041937708.1 G-protein coupled bile acid receptor 1 [Alosa sapidissima]XP_041937717.1 G-protein coupled bile acid receptor 1 [Alosa sapidissim
MESDELEAREWLISCITIPLSTAIILANLVIIVGILYNRQLHNTPNYFFLSLLVADLCTGVALPFIPRMALERSLNFHTCLLVHTFPNFLFLSYLFNLVMVHYERYLCIVSPLHYSQCWVHRCFPVALLAAWVPPLLYASLPAFGWNEWSQDEINVNGTLNQTVGATGCAVDPLDDNGMCSYRKVFPTAYIYLEVYGLLLPAIFLIAGMTGRVLWITRKQLRDICKLHRAGVRDQASVGEQRLNVRYAKCVAAVSLVFLLCWVPYVIYVNVTLKWLKADGKSQNSTTHIILCCTGIGSMAIIPFILGLANRQYTDPARKVLLKLQNCWHGMRDCTDM